MDCNLVPIRIRSMDSENTDLIEIDHDIKGMENSILRKNNEQNL